MVRSHPPRALKHNRRGVLSELNVAAAGAVHPGKFSARVEAAKALRKSLRFMRTALLIEELVV